MINCCNSVTNGDRMENLYPIFLNLKSKSVYVIGGGQIAARKLTGLLNTGANLTVISPNLSEQIQFYVDQGLVRWISKTFAGTDIDEAFYIISATNDPLVSEEIRKNIKPYQLVNYADDFSSSNAIVPSVVRRGRLVIAVTTSGASPSLTKKIKQELEEMYTTEYDEYIDFLMEKRNLVQTTIKDVKTRRKLLSLLVEDQIFRTDKKEERFQKIYKEFKDICE